MGVKKICVVGAPSTGKTTLASAITEELKRRGHKVEWAKEYARDFIAEHGPDMGAADQLFIVRGQKEREKEAERKNPEFVVCDCSSFSSYIYAFLYETISFDKKEKEEYKMILGEIWDEIKDELYSYDHVFFLPIEFSSEEDGVRLYTNKVEVISNEIKNFLISKKIEHFEIRGNIQERINQAFKIIF